jgi:hypothetical protein
MRTPFRTAIAAAAIAIACSSSGFRAHGAETPRDQIKASLDKLDAWLNAGPNAKGWNAYLDLPAFKAELEKDSPDPAAVDGLLKRLDSGAPGLELAPFREFRDALSSVSAELIVAKSASLPDAIPKFEDKYQPITAEKVTEAKKELESALGKLDKFLTSSGANGKSWREYLKWDALGEQLKSETADLKTLRSIQQLYLADQNGLELPVYSNAGDALERYVNRLDAQQEATREKVAEQLKGLADELSQYIKGYSQDLAAAVGGRLGWFQSMEQLEPLVRVIRGRVSRPNVFGGASARLVAAGIEQPVDDKSPVRDNILGTDISGTAHTVGKVTANLIPNPDKAMLETRLVATARTRTVGYNGPAVIQSSGVSQIDGRKRVIIDENGFAVYPATAAANTRTQILGVSAGGGIATRVANNRVAESKGEAERIAGQHAAIKARQRVDAQANTQLGKSHANFLQKFRNPLLRKREFPPLLKFSTTEDRLSIVSLQANRNQLAAPDDPPPITVEDNDLAVQAHESYINSLANALLSGVTLKQEEVEAKMVEWRGSVPEQLKSDEQRDPWQILMPSSKPIIVKIGDNGFRFTFRGQRYTAGDLAIRNMEVTADYKVEMSGNGARMVRQGELQIFPFGFVQGKDTLKPREIGWREKLRKRFGKIFEPEIKSEGLVLPGKWRDAGRLDLKQLVANGGWVALAWIESGEPAPPEDREDKKEDKVATDTK